MAIFTFFGGCETEISADKSASPFVRLALAGEADEARHRREGASGHGPLEKTGGREAYT